MGILHLYPAPVPDDLLPARLQYRAGHHHGRPHRQRTDRCNVLLPAIDAGAVADETDPKGEIGGAQPKVVADPVAGQPDPC